MSKYGVNVNRVLILIVVKVRLVEDGVTFSARRRRAGARHVAGARGSVAAWGWRQSRVPPALAPPVLDDELALLSHARVLE